MVLRDVCSGFWWHLEGLSDLDRFYKGYDSVNVSLSFTLSCSIIDHQLSERNL